MKSQIQRNEVLRLLRLMKKRLGVYISSMLLRNLISAVCFNIVIAFITKDVFDAITTGKGLLIKRAIILSVASYIIGSILSPIATYVMNKCIKETMEELRNICYEALGSLTIESIENQHSGYYISIVTNDINSIEAIYSTQMNSLAFAFLNGFIALISLFFLKWEIAVIVLLLGVSTIFINSFFITKLRLLNDSIQYKLKNITSRLIDILQSITDTKMYQAEKQVHSYFVTENMKHYDTSMKLAWVEAIFDSINVLFSNLKYIGVLCLSLYMFYKGYLVIGTMMAVMQLMGNANYMFDNIGSFLKDIQKSLAAGSNVIGLLDMEKEMIGYGVVQQKNETIVKKKDLMIEFEAVTFSYHAKQGYNNLQTLKDLNMPIKRNQITAIVGSSGSGKSTIAKLLMGFYEISSGNINIDGDSIFNYPLAVLRDKIAYVPQNAYIFYGTIEENIAYGKPGSKEAEIVSAAMSADAHDFIIKLPKGYATLVGEGGGKLSGGQKQRIALARAFLKDAPILILDEATSSLDSKTELTIQKNLKCLMKNRTTIIIAHRLSTIKTADKIYVLNNGEIIEFGNHEELILKKGYYQTLHHSQCAALPFNS
jgi:ATP-binding cassette subfamily B protein